MIKIIFEAHSTTFDNEAEISSGYNDVDLSPLGLRQSHELGERYRLVHLDGVYCSDLQRAYKTAAIAFSGTFTPIFTDARLRECDYGDLTQVEATIIKNQRGERVKNPFPNGESYEQTCVRMMQFLNDIAKRHSDGDKIMVIGHRATQYGLEHSLKQVPITEAVTASWKWQPGWDYELKSKKVG